MCWISSAAAVVCKHNRFSETSGPLKGLDREPDYGGQQKRIYASDRQILWNCRAAALPGPVWHSAARLSWRLGVGGGPVNTARAQWYNARVGKIHGAVMGGGPSTRTPEGNVAVRFAFERAACRRAGVGVGAPSCTRLRILARRKSWTVPWRFFVEASQRTSLKFISGVYGCSPAVSRVKLGAPACGGLGAWLLCWGGQSWLPEHYSALLIPWKPFRSALP